MRSGGGASIKMMGRNYNFRTTALNKF